MVILGRDRVAVKSVPAVVVRRRSGEKKGAENVGLALVPVAVKASVTIRTRIVKIVAI